MSVVNRSKSFEECTRDNIERFGHFILEHVDSYTRAICSAPCSSYEITLASNMPDELATIKFHIEHVDNGIY